MLVRGNVGFLLLRQLRAAVNQLLHGIQLELDLASDVLEQFLVKLARRQRFTVEDGLGKIP